jgi:hypothetical protein
METPKTDITMKSAGAVVALDIEVPTAHIDVLDALTRRAGAARQVAS